MLFGLCFPVVGTVVEMVTPGTSFPFTSTGFITAQRQTPLLWIIDAAPLILSVFGWLVRVPVPRADTTYRSGYLLHLAVALLGIVMLTMLGFTAREMLTDAQRLRDTNSVGTLRDRGLWVYGATITAKPKSSEAELRGGLAEMQKIRDQIARHYPQEVAATNPAWQDFTRQLTATGQVDWETANRMRIAANRLAENIAQQAKNQHEKAIGLLTLGAVSVLVPLLVSVTLIHRVRDAEAAHHKNRLLLAQAQAMAHVGSWKLNCVTKTSIWSDEMYRLLGIPIGSCAPSLETGLQYIHPEGVPRIRKVFTQARDTGEGYTIQYRILPADGSPMRYVHSLCQVEVDLLTNRPLRLCGTVRDITVEREQSEALRFSEARYRAMVEATNLMVWTISTQGKVNMDTCPVRKTFTGQTIEQAGGEGWMDALHVEDRPLVEQSINHALQTGETLSVQYRIRRHDGIYRWAQSFAVPVRDGDALREWVGTTRDITERKETEAMRREMEAHLEALAVTDGLTDIANRRAFDARLVREQKRALRLNQPLSLVLLDVDKFKSYNDAFGHPAGDTVLRAIAQLLSTGTREADLVARYGGEEFAIILPDTSAIEAIGLVERLRQRVEAATWAHRTVTASFGIATVSAREARTADLIADADTALYRAKKSRNAVCHVHELAVGTDTGTDNEADGVAFSRR